MACLDAEFWRQEWIGQKRKLPLPLLFGVDAGLVIQKRLRDRTERLPHAAVHQSKMQLPSSCVLQSGGPAFPISPIHLVPSLFFEALCTTPLMFQQ